MVLSPEKKLALLNAAKKIYQTYSALEIFKTKEFDIDGHQTTVLDFILQAKPGLTLTINTDNNEYTVNITNEAEGKRISISSKNAAAAFHSFIEYEENTSFALDLLCQHDFFIGHDNQVEIRLDQAFLGKNKIDLYRSHLVTIHNIITKLENEDDISNLLVALATGSGKTYVQALWMFILKQANCNGLFCIPDKLIPQFKDDLRRFLPDSMVDEIIILREKEDSPDAKAAISDLNNPNNTSHIVLASSEAILDNHYQELFDTNTDNAFFCFDEQHLLMKSERRRMRLIELSKKHLSMFLTATPNEETYELAGNKPVAIMSSGQKEQAGQGQFPKMFTEEAINYSDRNKLDDYRFWQLAFWENMANGLFLRFINSIQEEQSSAGISIVENLPFYLHRKPNETTERWALQAPVAHKILCIVDDNETLINLVMATQRSNSRDNRLDRTVYHNGNFISRQDAYEFFTLPMIDDNLVETHLEKKQHAYSLLNPEKIAREVAHRSLADQIKINIFHNLVNYILTDLTGFDTIKLNELRKKDLDGLVKLVKQKLTVKNEAYFRQKLQEKIGQDEASEVSPLLAELSQWLNNNKNNTVPFNKVIDNWDLNNSLKYLDSAYQSKFEAYANSHLALGLMTNMDKAETAIHESKPFLGFADNTYKLYDNDGALVSQAKKRARSSLEILSDQTEETSLSPNYIDITEEQADNLFRLGFV
ncbi:MAG: DEAD/DEAH box helicase family protein, partial [Proteobacteria bacterium]|nr:DEAD/DEAH box helicase family protein [Pseudomonadota bacterium]